MPLTLKSEFKFYKQWLPPKYCSEKGFKVTDGNQDMTFFKCKGS